MAAAGLFGPSAAACAFTNPAHRPLTLGLLPCIPAGIGRAAASLFVKVGTNTDGFPSPEVRS